MVVCTALNFSGRGEQIGRGVKAFIRAGLGELKEYKAR